MRQRWELPGPSIKTRLTRAGLALVLVWAAVAVPLTVWLVKREQPLPPPAQTRELTVVERIGIRYAARGLLNTPISMTSTTTSANAHLTVDQTADAAHGISYGKVTSGTRHAELLVVGERVMLRGDSLFWASVGVPTSDPGWIDVGDRLGVIPFPIAQALGSLAPDDGAQMDTTPTPEGAVVFRNGDVTAQFTEAALLEISIGDRTATMSPTPPDAAGRIAGIVATPVVSAKLVGNSGALTVSMAPSPPAPDEGGEGPVN